MRRRDDIIHTNLAENNNFFWLGCVFVAASQIETSKSLMFGNQNSIPVEDMLYIVQRDQYSGCGGGKNTTTTWRRR